MSHIPVLLSPIVKILESCPIGTIVDGTFGQGGYTRAFLEKGWKVIAFDRDPYALNCAKKLELLYPNHFSFFNDCFSNLEQHIQEPVNAVVFDLGVSSPQIDQPERGFSVRFNGPLDMRMSQTGICAKEVVNTFTQKEIANIIYLYGEDHDSRKIARLIVQAREKKNIETTCELVEIIQKVNKNPKKAFDSVIRSFQAIRIYVNNELEELEKGLNAASRVLSSEGLLMVVSFHSLEDRIAKTFIKTSLGKTPSSRYIPFSENEQPVFESFGKSLIVPTQEEIQENPRSRSAKLRVAKRTKHPWKEGMFL